MAILINVLIVANNMPMEAVVTIVPIINGSRYGSYTLFLYPSWLL